MGGRYFLDYRFDVSVPSDERHVRILNEMMGASPNPMALDSTPGRPYSAQFRVHSCGTIGMVECLLDSPPGSNALFIARRVSSGVACNPHYGFNIVVWLGGQNSLEIANRKNTLQTGDFTIMSRETPFCSYMLGQGHVFTLALPASWERIGDIRLKDIVGNIYSGQAGKQTGLIDYVQYLRSRPGALTPEASDKLYNSVALALKPHATSENSPDLLSLIRNYIELHCADPETCLRSVAAKFGVSKRHVHRLFTATGTSFTEYIYEKRLELARRMLESSEYGRTKILAVAYGCGFRDINHFGRRFRQRYGMTPREARQSPRR